MATITHGQYTTNIRDGSSPVDPEARSKLFGVCGYYTEGANGDVQFVNGSTDLDDAIGEGPVREFLAQYFREADDKTKGIFVLFANASADGANGDVEQTGTGEAGASVSGAAKWFVRPMVKIVEGGAIGTAQCAVSLDGGEHYGAPQTVPAVTGAVVLAEGLGLTITFDTAENPLVEDDTYAWDVTPKEAVIGDADTCGSIHKAIVDFFASTRTAWPELIHVAAPLDADAMATLHDVADDRKDDVFPCAFTAEARRIDWDTEETVSEYAAAMEALLGNATAAGKRWVGWILGYPTLLDRNGDKLPHSPAGALYGMMNRLEKISDSPEQTTYSGSQNHFRNTIYATQFTPTQAKTLNELGGSLVRTRKGVAGRYYGCRMGTQAGVTSPYGALDRVRVLIYAIGVVFEYLFPLWGRDLDGEDAVSMDPAVLASEGTDYVKQRVGKYVADVALAAETEGDGLTVTIQLQPRRKISDITANMAMVETITIRKGE